MGELALAQNLDEAGGPELLEVAGQGGGADRQPLLEAVAGNRLLRLAKALQDLVTTRVGKSPGDQRDLAPAETITLSTCHAE